MSPFWISPHSVPAADELPLQLRLGNLDNNSAMYLSTFFPLLSPCTAFLAYLFLRNETQTVRVAISPNLFLEIQKRSSCYRCLPVCHPPPLNPSYIITVFPKFHSPLRFLLSMLSVICKCTQSCIVPLYDLYVYIRAMVGGISLSTPPMSLIVYHFFLFLYFILFSLSFT